MLQILPVFLYMGVTCFILGYGTLTFFTRSGLFTVISGNQSKNRDQQKGSGQNYIVRFRLSYLLTGVVCATVYAEIFSLFAPVGVAANIVLVIICALIVFFLRKNLIESLLARAGFSGLGAVKRRLPEGYLLSRRIWLLYVLLLLGVAYLTSHGIMHYDTGLYHAQSIRFIEEYGVIKGLANLHTRFGYNSSSFAFSALYSFAFTGTPIHAGAGFFALLLSFACLDIKHILRRGRPVLTDFVRFGGLYYLFNIFKEIVSPAPDYFLNCFLLCLLIIWVELDVRHERHYLPYALLSVGFGFAVTIKLSALPMLLLAVKPVAMLIADARKGDRQIDVPFRGVKKRRSGHARTCVAAAAVIVAAGLVTAVPYFVRNLIISGYLVYPSTFPDIFGFVWKLPHDLAEGDAAGIRAYARGTAVAAFGAADTPITLWFMPWFRSQSVVSRILLAADICAVIGFAVYLAAFVFMAVRRSRKKLENRDPKSRKKLAPILKLSRYYMLYSGDFLFLEAALLLAFVFWFTQSPLIRYGFFFVWTPPLLLGGRVLLLVMDRMKERDTDRLTILAALVLTAFVLYKGARLIITDFSLMRTDYLSHQQEYERFTVEAYDVDGVTFYYPVEGDRTGYYGFPGGDHRADIRLLGDELKDGLADARTMK